MDFTDFLQRKGLKMSSTPKYVIHLIPTVWTLREGRIDLWIECNDEASATFAFNNMLGTTPEKDVEYTVTMYHYDFVSAAAATLGNFGAKTSKKIKSVNILNGEIILVK